MCCLNHLDQYGLCCVAAALVVPQEANALVGKSAHLVEAIASGCIRCGALGRNLERCCEGSLLLSRHSFEVDVFIWELLRADIHQPLVKDGAAVSCESGVGVVVR